MPKYEKESNKKPYNKSQSSVQATKENVATPEISDSNVQAAQSFSQVES